MAQKDYYPIFLTVFSAYLLHKYAATSPLAPDIGHRTATTTTFASYANRH